MPVSRAQTGKQVKNAPASKRKVKTVMKEFKKGKLKSGRSGKKVKSKKQAVAIALSEGRKAARRR
jgi:hypothetical protein